MCAAGPAVSRRRLGSSSDGVDGGGRARHHDAVLIALSIALFAFGWFPVAVAPVRSFATYNGAAGGGTGWTIYILQHIIEAQVGGPDG
jgi:hypothetical protein